MATVTTAITAAGASTPLRLGNEPDEVTFGVSGTYSGSVIYLQRSKSPGSDLAWETLSGPHTTDNATLALTLDSRPNDIFRVFVHDVVLTTDAVTGTINVTISDADAILHEFTDRDGNVIFKITQAGVVINGTTDVTGAFTATNVADPTTGAGAANGTGVAASDAAAGTVQKTVITLTGHAVTVTDALAYASSKLYDFPAGAIKVLGVVSDLSFSVTSVRATTINASAAMDWSLGSAAASSVTLASTMVDFTPKQDLTLDGVDAAAHPDVAQDLVDLNLDGTTTAADLYLNISFPITTEIDADGTIEVTGTITIHWINMGDY